MKFFFKSISKLLFTFLIILFTSQFASALNVCPGQSATLTWGITSGTATACNTKLSSDPGCPFRSSDPDSGSKTIKLTSGSCTVNFQCQNGTKADGTPNYSNARSDTLGLHTGTALWVNNCCTVGTNLANGTTVYQSNYVGEWGYWVEVSGGSDGGSYWETCSTQEPVAALAAGCYRIDAGGSCTAPALPATGSITGATCTIPTGASSCNNTLTWSSVNNLSPILRDGFTWATISTLPSGTLGYPTPYGTRNVTLSNGAASLATGQLNAECAAGDSFVSGLCLSGTVNVSLTAPDCRNSGSGIQGQVSHFPYLNTLPNLAVENCSQHQFRR